MSKAEEFVKGVWKQEPLIHTPQELTHIAKSLLHPNHPDIGGQYTDEPTDNPDNNFLHYMGNNKESAEGECDKACRYAHDFLPHGSHVKEYRDPGANNRQYGNHYVHHVPTTDGMYVVDYTQRQFNANAKFPVVEPKDKYEARQAMRRFSTNLDRDHRVL